MTELKPCPFCGGEAEYSVIDSRQEIPFGTVHHFVSCKNHCIEGLYSRGESKEEAIEAWNKRNTWHTGIPTEEGQYLVAIPFLTNGNGKKVFIYETDYLNSLGKWRLFDKEVVAWQRIEPFEESSE